MLVAIAVFRQKDRQSSNEGQHFIFISVFLIGTDLLARAAVQGVGQALVGTAIEYGSAGLMQVSKGASRK